MNAEDGGVSAKRLKSPLRFGEIVGVASVVIAGLGLYVSYANHTRDQQAAIQSAHEEAAVHAVLVLRAEGQGASVRLEPANPDQVVQNQTFYFPSAVRRGPVQTTGEGRLEAAWFASGLKQALRGADDDGAEHDLPVAVRTDYVQDGEIHTDQALYRIGFSIHRRLLQGAEVRIEGLALGRRGIGPGLQAAADAAWPQKP
ncbi:MAG TPA: hypothetical protein VMU59_08700 [Caulobacteraceae bacterium]|nr:hypothetical protein [Caulobacteraceae bacterium]